MKWIILAVLCLGAGLLGGAWSARGEIATLREQSARLRRDLDRARKARTAADLAMVARIGQNERPCAPAAPPPRPEKTPVNPEPAPPVAAPSADPPATGSDFPLSPEDRTRAFDEFAADLALDAEQQQAVRRVGEEFQRALEEKLGGFLARLAMVEATGETPRPREVVRASDELLHVYLGADDKLRALLDEDQVEALEESDFDLVMLVDFASLEGLANRHAPQPPHP